MSGTSVPEGFRLPWNTIRSMADVWPAEYVLQGSDGRFFHANCIAMTSSRNNAWKGTEREINSLRRRYPDTQRLTARVA